MKTKRFLLTTAAITLLFTVLSGQQRDSSAGYGGFRGSYFVFWNLENFFDTKSDIVSAQPEKESHQSEIGGALQEFSAFGKMRWGRRRFVAKRDAIAKTIMDMGEGSFPLFVGVAEIENRYVLNSLIYDSPLSFGRYWIIHKDSPDSRGIDVALLYRRDLFRVLSTDFIRVVLPDTARTTRDILYARGVVDNLDTLHIFINHWPSKFGGEKLSRPAREAAAYALKRVCDSILDVNSMANIIVAGDFNDTPDSEPMKLLSRLVNLAGRFHSDKQGTIKYRGVWELIDQILVSENLLNKDEPVYTEPSNFSIFNASYLLERDKAFTGFKPKRTYIGPRYNGGISDHLPVRLLIYFYTFAQCM
ncbi:MAG: endonuclease [Bacteroidales bacterium]|nr:endonuclease [Bacteroidales bacterium]